MTHPAPRRPSKTTITVSKDGRTMDILIEIFEVSREVPDRLKPALERAKRDRREARERAARKLEDQQQAAPPADPAPPGDPP